jgi:hypothetical protein
MAEIFDHVYPSAEGLSERLAVALRKIEFARNYTMISLEGLSDDDWFWVPENPHDYVTHIAWQVGHIAMSEYGLTLFRQRGRKLEDSDLMSGKFRKLFMKGTTPKPERDAYPSPSEILEVLSKVHQQMRSEIASLEETLDEESGPPHAAYATKYGALLFAPDHEMLHAGQIGMLRRMMGKPPMR